jgi:hypothetical protein
MTEEGNKMETPRFSLGLDGLIIDGFFKNQIMMFRKLKAMGFSKNEIIDRVKQLGLSEQFVKRCAVGHPDVAQRKCLRCSDVFLSVGFQNRLCSRCKGRQW